MNIRSDSRKVKPGDVFFCLKGTVTDGHKFADKAAENGAAVIVYQDDLPTPHREGVHYVKVEDTLAALNSACDVFYGYPSKSLHVFGLTGTNGKTTTASVISQVFSKYEPCGYIGTIYSKYGSTYVAPTTTTPEPIALHELLKDMVDSGMKAVAIEVSAHGLTQGRVDAVDFDYAIFTNFTQDHLDYYHDMEHYLEAKKLLFKMLKPSAVAIINADSSVYDDIAACADCKTVSYGIHSAADYAASDIEYRVNGTTFTLSYPDSVFDEPSATPLEIRVCTNLVAEYNLYNLLSAAAAMHQAGMPMEDIAAGFDQIEQIPGRMQHVDCGQDFTCIVDYAHTPDGYEQLLSFLRSCVPEGRRLITVCGAPGGRDHTKRRQLGEIARKYSDELIITCYDVRDETSWSIVEELAAGVKKDDHLYTIDYRDVAISQAISLASAGDIVAILGKGAEEFMYTAEGKVPYEGDHAIAAATIAKKQRY